MSQRGIGTSEFWTAIASASPAAVEAFSDINVPDNASVGMWLYVALRCIFKIVVAWKER